VINTKKEIPEDILSEIIDKYKKGLSILKLSKEYPYSDKIISRSLKEKGIAIRGNSFYQSKYTFDETYFDKIDNQFKAYWLGFIFADGYIANSKHGRKSIGISLSKKDEDHLKKFKEHIKSTYPIKTYTITKGYNVGNEYVRILMKSDRAINKLIEYGVDFNKSYTCKFPSKDIVPLDLMNHFIRGYFDGNGSLKLHSKSSISQDFCVAFCGTKEMMMGIQNYIPLDKTFKLRQRHPERDNNNYSLEIGGRLQVKKIMDYIYHDAKIYLERKFERYQYFLNEYNKIYNT